MTGDMREAIHIRNVPANIRRKVVADAKRRDLSVNDVVGEILANHYAVAWESTGYRFTDSDSDQWFLRIPAVLKAAIAAHARAVGGRQTGCVLNTLAQHYNLKPVQVTTRRAAPEAQIPKRTLAAIKRRVEKGESIRALEREYGLPRMTINRALQRDTEARVHG